MLKKYFILSLLLLFVSAPHGLTRKTGHDFTAGQCAECHAMKPEKGVRKTLRMNAPIKTLCMRCHRGYVENSLSHPVEMTPSSPFIPEDLPLSWDGKMTCSTCHDFHATEAEAGERRIKYLRRNSGGRELCAACHAPGEPFRREGVFNQVESRAMHVAHMTYTPTTRSDGVDGLSRMCLTCHVGNIRLAGMDPRHPNAGKFAEFNSQFYSPASHPIGMSYEDAFRRGGLHPVNKLNPVIRLFDGKVGCCSCHDPYSSEPFRLVISNSKSQLCVSCHDKAI